MATAPRPRPADARLERFSWFGAGLAVAAAGFAGYVTVAAPLLAGRAAPAARTPPAPFVVQVAGEVAQPGLYDVPPGGRVEAALRAAGGTTAEADLAQVNLAARVTDGQRIVVPRKAAAVEAGAATAQRPAPTTRPSGSPGLVNLNTASFAELDTLPGVGPVTAQKILDERARAPFTSAEQLLELKLVTSATYERIRDLVTVS
jgi:competence protein ComEA